MEENDIFMLLHAINHINLHLENVVDVIKHWGVENVRVQKKQKQDSF